MSPIRILAAATILLCPFLDLPAQALLFEVQGGISLPSLHATAAGLGDVNGDAVPDFASALYDSAPASVTAALAQVRSGIDGTLIWEASVPSQGYGSPFIFPSLVPIAAIGDLSGDGISELALGISRNAAPSGSVRILDGASGVQLQIITSPAMGVTFGGAVAGVGDVNGDQVPDFAVGSPHIPPGWFQICSGVGANVLVPPTPLGTNNGAAGSCIALIGDYNGDGSQDMAVGAPLHTTSPGSSLNGDGTVFIVTAGTGQIVATIGGFSSSSLFGQCVVGLGDVNGDGLPDLVVGAPQHVGAQGTAGLFALAGGTGSLLWSMEQPLQSGDASSLASIADVDGDGHRDVVVGNGSLSTNCHIVSGTTGSIIASVTAPQGNPFNAVADLGDINGDLAGDFVVVDGNSGAVRVHSGGDVSAQVITLGSSGGPGAFFLALSATLPQLPSVLTFNVTGAAPAANGWLGIAPGPPNPFQLFPGFVIQPDITQTASWAFFPVGASLSGAWTLSLGIPFHVTLLGRRFVAQAWFPPPYGLAGTTITNGLGLRLGL